MDVSSINADIIKKKHFSFMLSVHNIDTQHPVLRLTILEQSYEVGDWLMRKNFVSPTTGMQVRMTSRPELGATSIWVKGMLSQYNSYDKVFDDPYELNTYAKKAHATLLDFQNEMDQLFSKPVTKIGGTYFD